MSFSEKLKTEITPMYQSKSLAKIFYEPVLSEAKVYKRVSAYFSSAGLSLYSQGLDKFFDNDGYVQFIISTDISESDFQKIKEGYDVRKSIQKLARNLQNAILSSETRRNLGNLAFMIARGHAEVKFALISDGAGIFHDKFGLIESDDDIIFFNGSVNETQSGLELNYESISVDVSWDFSENVKSRIKLNKERFDKLWKNEEIGVITIDATDLVYEQLRDYQVNLTSDVTDLRKEVLPNNFTGIYFRMKLKGIVSREDYSASKITLTDRKLRIGSDLSNKYFEDDNVTIKSEFSYMDIENIIDVTRKRCDRKQIEVVVSNEVADFLLQNKYSIEQYKKLGQYLKAPNEKEIESEKEAFVEFEQVVQSQVVRPLKDLQLRVAYYEYRMARAANFSVPGAGKTAMILGVFAYLNRENIEYQAEKVDKLLVICPINAFDSWKTEFKKVFGKKKKLKVIDSQSSTNFERDLILKWNVSNLVLVNYESLPKYLARIQNIMEYDTLLVFDEVHRIKNPNGQWAKAALELSKFPKFKFVLTGTPIPNTYVDIYNFLHLLYGNEYNSYFRWSIDDLKKPNIRKIEEINKEIAPFFWRVNKKSLGVPKADPDEIIAVNPSSEQQDLAESIYYTEKSSLAQLIRLIQASTNPELITKEITYKGMGFSDEGDTVDISEDEFYNQLNQQSNFIIKDAKKYSEYNFSDIVSPKFEAGIKKVKKLVAEGKKVIIWAIFVDTMQKIQNRLNDNGIKASLVYGSTPVENRQEIIDEFKYGETLVLVSNPQTLGESVSLHENVHDAIYFEYNFNLTFMLQSRDRIHRLGLKENQYTRYFYLQTNSEADDSGRVGYIDSKIYDRLKRKEEIMNEAIDNDNLTLLYSENEIKEAIKIIEDERTRVSKNRR